MHRRAQGAQGAGARELGSWALGVGRKRARHGAGALKAQQARAAGAPGARQGR